MTQRYRFVARYSSGVGTWDPGQMVDLEPEQAEWFNRDVPGCLEPVDEEQEQAEAFAKYQAEKEAKARALEHPPSDRQQRRADRR